VAGKEVRELSKGYRQRVGLAQAMLHDPDILILDEPTSGLDPNQIIEIRDVIRQLGKNKTVLFSSHILQEVEALCDRVVIINRGRLVADSQLSRLRQENSQSGKIRVTFEPAARAGASAGPDVAGGSDTAGKTNATADPGSAAGTGHSAGPTADQLRQLLGVTRVTHFPPGEWELDTQEPDEVKKLLLTLALQNNWNIVSLQSKNQSLEEIFRSLTSSPQTPIA
jgi:ABC-2 type transport system ATP-binding protein